LYFVLSEVVKVRLIQELRNFWAQDPKYKDTLTPNIQGKFSFQERPQQGIVLKVGSQNPQKFSADNFLGVVVSYCHLTKAFGKPGTSIEWIEEDGLAIQRNGGVFPSPPGVYYIEVRKEIYTWKGVPGEYLVFFVDPLLSVIDERPAQDPLDPRTYTLSQGKFQPGSLNLYEMPGNLPLYEGVNYQADPETGVITLIEPLPKKTFLSADYYYPGQSSGPFPVQENGADNKAIPGVVLAFGRRGVEGDVMAVVIGERREGNSREYGGKFEVSVEMDIIARDVYSQNEIADRTLMYLNSELRDRLSFEGFEIDSVSFGGESEEVYDETGDDYFYNGSISLTLLTDWAIRVPFCSSISRVLPGSTVLEDQVNSALSDEQLIQTGFAGGLKYADKLGLQQVQDPWFKNRSNSYELIR
jgi:hypothetical protein